MSLVTGTLGRPIQGISQQPNNTRIDGQCTESVNMTPDVVKGLTNRAGTVQLSSLPFTLSPDDAIHFYNRDDEEVYFIVVPKDTSKDVMAFSPDGQQHNSPSKTQPSPIFIPMVISLVTCYLRLWVTPHSSLMIK